MQARDPAPAVRPEELLSHLDWLRTLARAIAREGDADDVVQETWREALERPPRHRANLRAWLARVARNSARGIARSERRRSDHHRLATAGARSTAQTTESPAELAERAALQRAAVDLVLELEPPQREVILLRYFRGLGIREVARELDLPLNTVRSRHSRALAVLRARLDSRDGGRDAWVQALAPGLAPAGLWGGRAAAALVAVALAGTAAVGSWRLLPSGPNGDTGVTLASPSDPAPTREQTRLSGAIPDEGRKPAPEGHAVPRPRTPFSAKLRVRVVDAATGEPIPGLRTHVYSTRGKDRIFAAALTNETGELVADGLPGTTIVVETERRPPHAIGTAAIRLKGGENAELVISAGRGASVRGRVADDLGAPLEGYVVVVEGSLQSKGTRFARPRRNSFETRTEADGTFRVDHLVSIPNAARLLNPSHRKGGWKDPAVRVRHPRFGEWRQVSQRERLLEGEAKDLGVIVFPRAVRFSGVVVREGTHEPIAGALVSGNPDRKGRLVGAYLKESSVGLPPLDPGFELHVAEALTDTLGRYTVELPWIEAPAAWRLFVWTQDGIAQSFPVPQLDSGEHRQDLVLAVRHRYVLEVSFGLPNGNPLASEVLEPARWVTDQPGPLRFLAGEIQVDLLWGDQTITQRYQNMDGDGVLRLPLGQEPESIRRLRFLVRGFRPIDESFQHGLTSGTHHVFQLEELPRVLLSLQARNVDAGTKGARLHACLIPPPDGFHLVTGECCGLGSVRQTKLRGETELFVLEERSYWVFVRTPGLENAFGPFEASEVRHDVVLEPRNTAIPPPKRPTRQGKRAIKVVSMAADRDVGQSLENPPRLDPHKAPVRFVQANGDALPQGIEVDTSIGSGWIDGDGCAELTPSFDAPISLTTPTEHSIQYIDGFQVISPDSVVPGEPSEIRLAPWRDVDVWLDGVSPDRRYSHLELSLQALGEGYEDLGTARSAEILSPHPGRRRFRFLVGPGRYRLLSRGALERARPIEIEVLDVEGVQAFTTTLE